MLFRSLRRNPSCASVSFRAVCFIQVSFGWRVIPAISTVRVLRRITKKTKYRTNPPRVSASAVKKSAAARPSGMSRALLNLRDAGATR